jgi:hypothetical protein
MKEVTVAEQVVTVPQKEVVTTINEARSFAVDFNSNYAAHHQIGIQDNFEKSVLFNEYVALYQLRHLRYGNTVYLNHPITEVTAEMPIFRWLTNNVVKKHDRQTAALAELQADIAQLENGLQQTQEIESVKQAHTIFDRLDSEVRQVFGPECVPTRDENSETFRSMVQLQTAVDGSVSFLKRSANMMFYACYENREKTEEEKCRLISLAAKQVPQ